MSQPIGMFRYTDPEGESHYIEATHVSEFKAIAPDGLKCRIEKTNGEFRDCRETPRELAERYNAVVHASQWGTKVAANPDSICAEGLQS